MGGEQEHYKEVDQDRQGEQRQKNSCGRMEHGWPEDAQGLESTLWMGAEK
ncbi:MAG: hypothetical protein ACLFTB_04095 [Desulfovibrionales bacterium]